MSEYRWGWLPESRRAALHGLLLKEAMEWSREWWIHHAVASVDIWPLEEILPPAAGQEMVGYRMGEGRIAFIPGRGRGALGCHLAACAGHSGDVLAQSIGAEALTAFAQRIARRADGVALEGELLDCLSPALVRASLGAYVVTLILGAYRVTLCVERSVVDRLVPPKSSVPPRLVSRAMAIGQCPVPLTVNLSLGTVSLSQLGELQVGEVLVGDISLDAPIEIRTLAGVAVATGGIGRLESQRAITLNHALMPEKNAP